MRVTGIILAGGKSRRMGKDKIFLPFPDRPLLEVMVDKLSSLFPQLLIITHLPVNFQEKDKIKVAPDILPNKGPLGGIYTGLLYSRSEYNFIVACDLPFLQERLVRKIIEASEGYDVILPEWGGRLQPLCAVYSRNCISPIEKELRQNNLKITSFFSLVKVRVIEEEEVLKWDPEGISFLNINTPEDYRRAIHGRK